MTGEFRADRLREHLARTPFAQRIVVLAETGSTNDAMRERAANGAEAGTIVVADRQTSGRGRHGRTWHSPPGLGLYLSMLFRPASPAEQATRWTLAAAVAACEACRRTGAQVAIEWPNDLVAPDGRKLGGILAELRSGPGGGGRELILGLGLNVVHRELDFPPELRALATSLARAGAPMPERERLAADFVLSMSALGERLDAGDWETVRARWHALAVGAFGRRVRVLRGGGSAPEGRHFEGITDGIDGSGALLVALCGGGVETVHLSDSVERWEARPCC
jgi:BirA family biotin operon repressor/biotin-[acetyl-CoA-carboxylase] ligase